MQELLEHETRFVLRWVGHHLFFDAQGVEKKLWQIALGKRPWGSKEVYDAVKQCTVKAGVFALPVRHAAYACPLWLVVVRRKGSSWYLITNEPVETEKQAWKIVFAYMRRWQIEMSFRYGKSELAMEGRTALSGERKGGSLKNDALDDILLVCKQKQKSWTRPFNFAPTRRVLQVA